MIDDEATKKPDLHEVLRVKELERLDALYKRIESDMTEQQGGAEDLLRRSPLEAEFAVSELAAIRTLLDNAGVPDRGVGIAVRVANLLTELSDPRDGAA